MKATTIKVEGELLQKLGRRKPASQSLSAFVKSILHRDLLRRELGEAASRYVDFIAGNPEEKASIEEWESADLEAIPSPRRRK